MSSDLQRRSESEPPAVPSEKKPIRFKFGVGLLILYPLMWIFATVVPFLPLEARAKAGIVGIDLAVAEGVLLLGVACVGKKAYQAVKARFRRKKRQDGATEVAGE